MSPSAPAYPTADPDSWPGWANRAAAGRAGGATPQRWSVDQRPGGPNRAGHRRRQPQEGVTVWERRRGPALTDKQQERDPSGSDVFTMLSGATRYVAGAVVRSVLDHDRAGRDVQLDYSVGLVEDTPTFYDGRVLDHLGSKEGSR